MSWVNTVEGALINLSYIKEIKFYNIDYKEEFLGIRVDGIDLESDCINLGYFNNYEEATSSILLCLYKEYYKFEHSFRDICRQLPEMKELDSLRSMDNFDEYWERSNACIEDIFKKCSKEEIEIEIYP